VRRDDRGRARGAGGGASNTPTLFVPAEALSGAALIRSSNEVFRTSLAVNMALDVLTERGFTVVLDVQKTLIPSHVDGASKIVSTETRVLVFSVSWPKPDIRATAT